MTFVSYTDFLFEAYSEVNAIKVKRNFLSTIANYVLEGEDREITNLLIREGQSEAIFDIAYNLDETQISELYESIQNGTELNEESLIAKFKEKAAAALNTVKEKGKSALSATGEAILKVGGSLLKALKFVTEKIGKAIKAMWSAGVSAAKSAVDAVKEKIEKKVKTQLANPEDKKHLGEELKNLTELAKGAKTFVIGDMGKAIEGSAQKAAAADESYTYESYLELGLMEVLSDDIKNGVSVDEMILQLNSLELNESGDSGGLKIPLVSAVMKKLSKFPPFSLIHKAEDVAKKVAESGLNRMSILLNKIGAAGGPYTFPVLAGIVGIGVGYYLEQKLHDPIHQIAHALQHALHFAIPGLGFIMDFITYGGIALAVHGLVTTLAGSKGEEKHDEEPKEETKEDPKEEPKKEKQ
jgi:hypothetical protein